MKYLMAIDAGTGSVRSIIFDINGNEIYFASREWVHISEKDVPNSMRFDFQKNWELVRECIKESIMRSKIDPKDILAVSSTSMREGIVLYDKDKNELWGVANVDARTSNEVKYLKEQFTGIEEKFYRLSGQTFALGALPRLLWLKNHRPDIYEKVYYISMISDWILKKLSGEIATEPSNAGTTGIFNLQSRNWQTDMAKKVGLKDDIFPPVLESAEILSNVSKKASFDTKLSTDTKVVMGGGDVQLGSAGLGVVEVGDSAILGGSFWQQIVNIPKETKPPEDMSIRINPHVIKDQSQAEGITFFSGLVMRWFKYAFCHYERMLADPLGKSVYELLEARAKNEPVGSNGIIPIFSDEMKYGKWYHASPSFINLNLDPKLCNKYTLFRSLEENAAIVSNINLKKIEHFADIKSETITFAGGASKGELWSQIVADVTGKVVNIPKVKEATALGAAMSAGVGAGVYKSIKEASKELVVWEKSCEPNSKNHEIYQEIAKKWKKVYEEQLKIVDAGLVNSMWMAPGL